MTDVSQSLGCFFFLFVPPNSDSPVLHCCVSLGFADKNGATVKFVREGEKESDAVEYSYDYSVRKDNMNARSMQMLSRSAGERMKGYDGEYFEDFRHFVDYYGSSDYADKWILSVAKSTVTTFSKG